MYASFAQLPLGPLPTRRDGVKLVFPELDLNRVRSYARGDRHADDPPGWRAWLRGYRGTRAVGVLDPRDPGPFVKLVGSALGRRLRRLRRTSR